MSRTRGISVDLVAEVYQFPVSLQRSSSARVELTLWTWVQGQRFVRKRENLEGMVPGYRCDFFQNGNISWDSDYGLPNGSIMVCGGHVSKMVFYLGDWLVNCVEWWDIGMLQARLKSCHPHEHHGLMRLEWASGSVYVYNLLHSIFTYILFTSTYIYIFIIYTFSITDHLKCTLFNFDLCLYLWEIGY